MRNTLRPGTQGSTEGTEECGKNSKHMDLQSDREVQGDTGAAEEPKVYKVAWGCWDLAGASRGCKSGPETPISYPPWQCPAGGCPSLAPGLRAGRTRPSQAGAPCGNKQMSWGTRRVMGSSFLGTCLSSHLVTLGERRRAVRSPNIQGQISRFGLASCSQFKSKSCDCGQLAVLPTLQGTELPGAVGSPGAVGCVHVDNG